MAFLEYQPRTPLFHYCGPGGFGGITQNGSIWLSDLRFANDPKELQLADVIEMLMRNLIEDSATSADLRSACEALVPRMRHFRDRWGLNSFSLSLKADQLPMWQEYTDRGRGFCIGFRATAFNHMPLRIQKVLYVSDGYFGTVGDRVKALLNPLIGQDYNEVEQILASSRITSLATSVKDHSWQHEEEIRLIFSSTTRPTDFEPGRTFPIGELPDGTAVFAQEPLYRDRDGSVVPYHVKPFGHLRAGRWDASRAIKTVILGPNNTRSTDDVTGDLLGYGYRDFEVIRSRCAFR